MAEFWSISGPLVGAFPTRMQESSGFAFGFGHEAVDEELDADDLDKGGSIFADCVVSLTLQGRKHVAKVSVKSRSSVATFGGGDHHLAADLMSKSSK